MDTQNISILKINKLTQAQYDRELAAGRIDESAIYLTPYEEVDLRAYITADQVSETYETKHDAESKFEDAKIYADNAAADVKNDLLNGAGTAYDTLKELGDLIDNNKDAIDALEDIASGKADTFHTHIISDMNGTLSIANGGTGATTAEEARVNLGITSGISKTLLWENSAPDEEMVYTELTIDNMNDYDGIEIIWQGNTAFDLRNTGFIPLCQPSIGSKVITTTLIFDVYDPTNVPPIYVRCFRDIQISSLKTGVPNASHAANNMVKIDYGYVNSSEDEEGIGYIEDNGVCIPYRIYGIKGVQ